MFAYTIRVLTGLDVFVNTLMGGQPNETISERAARLRDKRVIYGCIMCRVLDFFAKDHCDNSRAT